MKKGYAIVIASGWDQCDTDEDLGDFGFAASVGGVYPDYNETKYYIKPVDIND